ncbi:hypothetical protein KSC_107550 [Ktedonobacter sp. SOSP1-52]|uniref:cyclic nucleotide-binding domain-containing protein n=1 Tax=Ktedonobacter sp. SOSP1-52 TaxID=2778366 RepID=UPI00191584DD|nr:cyclic nucleotide-binding domain-containing protein [Ktedonobacter sp. SOSP1-52]GHO71863.1 hypothetical protein KSC_107550 [Ktedonobacter sp. SOSP1-52]
MSAHTSMLAKQPFLEHMEPRYVRMMSECGVMQTYDAGTYIFQGSDPATHLYLITQGKVMLELNVRPHSSAPFETLGPGDILGWAWLIPPYRWSFHAYALTSVEIIALDGECLRREAQDDLHFGFALLDCFARILLNRLEARSERHKQDLFTEHSL